MASRDCFARLSKVGYSLSLKLYGETDMSSAKESMEAINKKNSVSSGNIKNLERPLLRSQNDFKALSERGRPGGASPSIQYFREAQRNTLWIGKCGLIGLLQSNHLEEYKELLALRLYALLGVPTPNICLSLQLAPPDIRQDKDKLYAEARKSIHEPRVHIMSEFLDGFQTLGNIFISIYKKEQGEGPGKKNYHHISYQNKRIPLKGFGSALAVAGFLHDYDCLGNWGGNMGYIINAQNPNDIFAEIVKIDGGEALPFNLILEDQRKHNPKDRKVPIGSNIGSLSFSDLTIPDQQEFIRTSKKILSLSINELEKLFRECLPAEVILTKTRDEWLQLLIARRDLFVSAYAPEVYELLQKTKLEVENQLAENYLKTSSSSSSSSCSPANNKNIVDLKKTKDESKGTLEQLQNAQALQQQLAGSQYAAPTQAQHLVQAGQLLQTQSLKSSSDTSFQLPVDKPIVGRKEQLEILWKQFSKSGVEIQCICGLGGIGKTQLATRYVYQALENKRYEQILWLYAEHHQLLSQIQFLVETWYKISAKEMDLPTLLRRFYGYCQNKRICVVIDNATDKEAIQAYLPPRSLVFSRTSTLHILITSRYQTWTSINTLNLAAFSSEETLACLNAGLGSQQDPEQSAKLFQILGGLPLAIIQATAYIKQKGINIQTYCELFTKTQSISQLEGDAGVRTVSTTLTLSIAELEKTHKNFSETLGPVLSQMAYLSPEHLNLPLLCSLVQRSENDLKTILETLHAYSFIHYQGNRVSIHRMTQAVIRHIHERRKEAVSHYTAILNWLTPQLEYDEIKIAQETARMDKLIPHALHLATCLKAGAINSLSLIELLNRTAHYFLYVKRDGSQAKSLLEEILNLQERHYGKDHYEIAFTLRNLGNVYDVLGNAKQEKELFERSLKIQETTFGKNHPEVANTLNDLGKAYIALGNAKQAKDLLVRSLKIAEAHFDKNHLQVAAILTNLGNAYGDLGDAKRKKEFLERTLKIQVDIFGNTHPEVANTLMNLGNAYCKLGDMKRAKEFLERALKIQEATFGYDHPTVANTLASLGIAYGGEFGGAKQQKELLERALKIQETTFGKNDPSVASTLSRLGSAYLALRDAKQAKELLERALKIQEATFGKNHLMIASTLSNLGNAYGFLGDAKQAKELLERALKIQEVTFGADHVELADILLYLIVVNKVLKNIDVAYGLAERRYQIFLKAYGAQDGNTQVANKLKQTFQEHLIGTATISPSPHILSFQGNAKRAKELTEATKSKTSDTTCRSSCLIM